ncbi:MAG: general secretion pathway protein GspB [Planctomycetes bacterium]|nr:general secretion pathway protein GspB [Planctomycetota bacterium]
MKEKKTWRIVLAGGITVAGALGFLIWSGYDTIAASREEVGGLHQSIDSSRKLLAQTGDLERDVIVLRETEQLIKEILPDEQDLNNFVRDLRAFEEESGVHITGLKKKADASRGKKKDATDFEKATYQLTIEADAFQWLAFLNRVESHSRFMSVPSFKLSAAPRRQVEDGDQPYAHKIQMDIETYVYAPQGSGTAVKIDGYSRKRELLLGEIARHRAVLAIANYTYRGQHGRRDPWVDPRVSADVDPGDGLSVEEQIQIVSDLAARSETVTTLYDGWKAAPNELDKKLKRAELEKLLASLEEDVRRTIDAGQITFAVSKNELEHRIAADLERMRESMTAKEDGRGANIDELTSLIETMQSHMAAGEYDLTLAAFANVEPRLGPAELDPARKDVCATLREIARSAKTASDFSKLQLDVGGIVIMEDRPPVVLINGRPLTEGDLVDQDLIIKSIQRDEIEFIFRGVILLRRF